MLKIRFKRKRPGIAKKFFAVPPYPKRKMHYAYSELKYLAFPIAFLCAEWYAIGEGGSVHKQTCI